MKKVLLCLLVFFVFAGNLFAQMETATWTFKSNKLNDTEYELIFSAYIIPNYHMYSMNVPSGGPTPLKIIFEEGVGYELVGELEARTEELEEFDEIFEMDVKYFDGEAVIVQKIKLTASEAVVKGIIEYQTCGENQCFQGDADFSFNLAKGIAPGKPSSSESGNESLLLFFLIAFITGIAGFVMPCVFPMVPMTISFFMGGESDKKIVGITKALIFSLSVTLIYTLIGVIVALTQNATFAEILSNHWIPNLIFFLLFLFFALWFFGAFEISLPSSLANRADKQADKGGYIASFFLALVLAVVSFSCTGPFIGGILVEAVTGGLAIKPIIGMFGFGLGLSLPFFILALSPALLKKLPKSGGWLNAVKVVFAFIMIAFGMKFLTIVDTALNLNFITRDVFIAIWIVLFTLLGMYLLGKIKFSHDSDVAHVGVFRLFLAIASFTFALYLFPGLFGAPLATVSGLMPSQDKQMFDLTKHQPESPVTAVAIPTSSYQVGNISQPDTSSSIQNGGTIGKICGVPKYADFLHLPAGVHGYFDLKEGLACAKEQNKPILLDFKGHRCANCKKMDKEVFSDQRVIDFINKNFIIIGLYVDDDSELPQNEWVKGIDGKDKKTIGKINREYQMTKFKQASQPYFIIVDHNENVLTDGIGYMSSPDKYLEWLKKGLSEFEK